MKAANWDKLVDELHETTDNMVGVSKAQVIRKWHNWKQYNKQHGKPHPFVVVGDVVVDDIMQVSVLSFLVIQSTLGLETLDKAAGLCLETATPLTDPRQYINSNLGFRNLKI